MRLTIDILRRAPQFTNTLRQREIDLRGLGLTVLDERPLILLNDAFDILNLSQNHLMRLEYFPTNDSSVIGAAASAINTNTKITNKTKLTKTNNESVGIMQRLQSLIIHRNRISHVSISTCALVLPNLRAFLADHNEFHTLRDLLFIKYWKKLEIISLEHNPVTHKENNERLRAFIVFLCPKLKLVNYQRVTELDRRNVEEMREEFTKLLKEWQQFENAYSSNIINNNNNNDNNNDITSEMNGNILVTDNKKVRKRGREARAAAAITHNNNNNNNNSNQAISSTTSVINEFKISSETITTTTTTPAGLTTSTSSNTTHTNLTSNEGENSIQSRLEELEAKMMAAETEEELLEIQQEITELEAMAKVQAAAAKAKRSRTS